MIPYIQFVSFQLGPLTIYVWGLMVALGILAGTWLAARLARERGLNPQVMWDLAFWGTLGGFVGARLAHVAFYAPETYLADPWRILAIRDGGYSSAGAIIGGILCGVLYLKWKKLSVAAYADVGAFGAPLGYAIGRVGCFLIHDHPGTLTSFVLGVKYPDGVRHDLGLYEALSGFALTLLFVVLWKRKAPAGSYAPLFLIWYGASRFFLDFLRATDGAIVDARYGNLTPAQWLGAALFVWGLWLYRRRVV
ncbi:prolipoprotein diacylglyceryl transferase [Patescibacteria group bacterium]|nr:MAG: prolipoprotein diacylglyceryl transferase [Patescibacteria group bacterium]